MVRTVVFFSKMWLRYEKYSIFAKNEGKVVYAITEDFIEFRDSLILTQRPLRTFKEAYKLDIGKLSGEDFDYSILRSYKTVLTNDKLHQNRILHRTS